LSIDKTLAQRTRGTLRILGTLRPQANVLEISEQIGAPEVSCAGPTGEWIRPDSHHSNPPTMGSRQNQRLREQTLTENHVIVAASRMVDEWNSQHLPTSHCRDK
ncbi:hypothetical protein LSAT2_024684, partial [Lamellibrachia satsuma]